MSIIGGAIIAAAPAVIFAFFKIFGLDSTAPSASAPSKPAPHQPPTATSMKSELRFTETNAATDSKGRTWVWKAACSGGSWAVSAWPSRCSSSCS